LRRAAPELLDLVRPENLVRYGVLRPDYVGRLVERAKDPDYVPAVPIETDWLMIVLTFQMMMEIWPRAATIAPESSLQIEYLR
jgi:hypothetical protein